MTRKFYLQFVRNGVEPRRRSRGYETRAEAIKHLGEFMDAVEYDTARDQIFLLYAGVDGPELLPLLLGEMLSVIGGPST